MIYGGTGTNLISGGEGNDQLLGGTDSDTFLFDQTAGTENADTIDSFTVGEDAIALDASIFSAIDSSTDFFTIGTEATTADQHILFDEATGNLYYDADGSGSEAAQLVVTIETVEGTLSQSDFIV